MKKRENKVVKKINASSFSIGYESVYGKSKELEKVNKYYVEENMLNAVKILKENNDLHTQDEIIK